MADDVRGTQKEYPKHPEGQFAAVCCDIIDLGQRLAQFPGKPAYLADKFVIGFRTDSEEEVKDVFVEFTNTLSDKGNLLPFLVSWRGKSYTPDELRQGVQFKAMVGHAALITVEHQSAQAGGRTYAKIVSIARLPKGMAKPSAEGYQRAAFWAAKKAAYKDECDKWAAAQQKVGAGSAKGQFDDFPEAAGDDDGSDLPF